MYNISVIESVLHTYLINYFIDYNTSNIFISFQEMLKRFIECINTAQTAYVITIMAEAQGTTIYS